MFQLYKKRNFNSLINDTFSFFRIMGKNYFGNYIKIAGGFLLVLIVLAYLVGYVFFKNVFGGLQSYEQQQMLSKYFDDNEGYFIIVGVICALLLILISAISYAYPVVYLKLMENNGTAPKTSDIVRGLRKKAGKLIIFLLGSLITFVPIGIILGSLCLLLIVILIGFPIAIIIFGALSCWISLSLYDYLNNDTGYFTAFKNGFSLVTMKFWNNVGSTIIFYIIVYIVQTAISLLFYVAGGAITMIDVQAGDTEAISTLGVLMLISFIISTLVGYFLNNLVMINQGIIYYSSREVNENNSLHADIDLIGTDIE